MSQAVQLDMEVLQRIKFLMEYDVMKTSFENILIEQPRIRGAATSTAQPSDSQGKLGNTFDPISGQAKVLASRDPAVLKANQQKYGTIDVARTDVNRMYSQPSKEVREKNLDEITLDVRTIMSDWRTGTLETLGVSLGVGIPIVVGANGLWFTLELAQVLKGTPSWLDLVFSAIALATAGTVHASVLKPLYKSVASSLGKGKSVTSVLDEIFVKAKQLNLWDKLKPMLEKVSKMADSISGFVETVWKWLNTNVFWIFKGVTWLSKVSFKGLKTLASGVFNTIDTWMSYLGKKAGLSPETASKLGPAVRGASTIGGLGYGISNYTNQPAPVVTTGVLEKQDTSDWFKD
jgi:hypothetical protein